MKTNLFQTRGHCWIFQICWHIECSTFTASSFRIWKSSIGIPLLLLALFVVMLLKTCLTSHSMMSGSRLVIAPSWLSGLWKSFFKFFFCVFLPPLLNIFCFCSVHTISVLYRAHLCMQCSLMSLIFLNRFLLFLCIDHWGRLSHLSLLFFGTLHSDACIFSFLLCFSLPFFSQLSKPSSDSHFAFFHFFFLGMVLIPVSCTVSWTSICSSSGTLSVRSSPLNLFFTSTV